MSGRPDAPLAIVIFGAAVHPDGTPSATLCRRVAAAEAFGRTCAAPLFVPTGGSLGGRPAEAPVMAELLRRAGVPDSAILIEATARDTLESVLACSVLLRARGYRGAVAVASSAYHLPRCLVLMRLAGWRVVRVPPPQVPAARSLLRRWCWRLREGAALPWDALLLVLRRRAAVPRD